MRPEYVKLVKDFLLKHPEYKNSLATFQRDVLSIGATDTEFKEALSQLGIAFTENDLKTDTTPPVSKKGFSDWLSKMQNKPGFLKKLVEIDIITHVTIVFVVFVPLFIWTVIQSSKANTTPFADAAVPQLSSSFKIKTPDSSTLVGRVYASTDKVDAQRVFSYPPSDITLRVSGTPKKEIYGFFPYWMVGEEDKVNIDQMTDIALFELEVDGKGNIITSREEGEDPGWTMWNDPKLNELITRAKKKRVHIEITIKAFDKTNIENLVLSDEAQKVFISNVLHLVNLKSLNGVNLDFEYVGIPPAHVTSGFTRLVTNLNAELKNQIPGSTLTIDTYINAAAVPGLFDVELLSQQSDSLILMGYDIHTPNGDPGPVAPLDGPSSILGYMQSYLEIVPPEKIVLAVPYYGYDWPLKNDGTATGEMGKTLPYAEVAELMKGKSIRWDETAQSPSLTYTDAETKSPHILYFENVRSLAAKYDLINKKNLKGMGIWALGYDGLNNDLRSLIIEKFAN